MKRRPSICMFVAVVVAHYFASTTAADTTVWLSNTGGLFTDAANWSSGMPDSADDSAIFNRGNFTYTVTLPGHTIIQPPATYLSGSTAIGPNNVSFVQSSGFILGPSTYTTTSLVMGGTAGVPAQLNTSISNFSTTTASIGFGTGSPATLNVRSGAVTVTGNSGNGDLIVGDGSFGVLSVLSGANVTFAAAKGNVVIGKSAGVTGSVNVGGAGALWSMPSNDPAADVVVAESGLGVLNVTSGGTVNDYRTYIADGTGSVGTVMVSGLGAAWTNRDLLTIGNRGVGTLSISGGGQVTDNSSQLGVMAGSTGTALVDGAGSQWTQTTTLVLGSLGSFNGITAPGTMHITAGGQVTTGGDANVGSNGNGTATIDGSGSKWTANGLFFVNDKGNVGVSNGGQMLTGQAYVDGPVTVSGGNAIWNSSDALSIGNHISLGGSDDVNFNVTSGGAANSRVAFLGDHGAGIVSVDGNGSSWSTSDQLYVGFDGGGQLFVSNGAHITSGETQIGVSHGSSGTFSVADANSRWTNSGNVAVGVAGTGLLTVANGGVAEVDGLLSVGPRGTLEGNSHVTAAVHNGGTVAPGLSMSLVHSAAFAILHIDGDYTQTSVGQLAIQLNSATSFDTLAIAGHATLGGTLHASLSIGFTPTVGESFEVLTATNGISGTFTLNFETLSGSHGPLAVLVYSNSDVILKFINSTTADYNHNGTVDAADYVVWRSSVGQSGTSLAADGNGDGVVDTNDFNLWRSEFGQSAGAGAGSSVASAVPEPATLVLLIFAAAGSCLRRVRAA